MGRYRSTEDLSQPEFNEADEAQGDDDVFAKEKPVPFGPSNVELVASYDSYINNGRVHQVTPVEGWYEKSPPREFDEVRENEQTNILNGIVKEKGKIVLSDVKFLSTL